MGHVHSLESNDIQPLIKLIRLEIRICLSTFDLEIFSYSEI